MEKLLFFIKKKFLNNTLLKLITVVFFILIIGTVVLFLAEKDIKNSPYNEVKEAFFGTVVFVCSGFDADRPISDLGKTLSIFLIVFGIAIVSYITAIVASIIVEFKLKEELGMKSLSLKHHILICHYTKKAKDIINELHSDDIKDKKDVVIIDPRLEKHPLPDNYRVHFIKGDPSKSEILHKASIMTADTAIVLSEVVDEKRHTPTADAVTILTALAIETINPEVYSCVEVLDPENIHHLRNANVDEIICSNDISSKILVQSAVNHGLSRMITDILTFSDGNEIYKISVPKHLVGKDFSEALIELNKEKILLMSVEKRVSTKNNNEFDYKILTNPDEECIIEKDDKLFVLSKDQPQIS